MTQRHGNAAPPYAKRHKSSFIYPEVEEISRARREGREEEADRLARRHTAKHLRRG